MKTLEEIGRETQIPNTVIREAREEMIALGLPLQVIRAQIIALEDGLIVPLIEDLDGVLR